MRRAKQTVVRCARALASVVLVMSCACGELPVAPLAAGPPAPEPPAATSLPPSASPSPPPARLPSVPPDVEVAFQSSPGTWTALDARAVKIGATRTVLANDEDLLAVLEKAGIQPDGESLGLLYELNSAQLTSTLPKGFAIVLPTVDAADGATPLPSGRLRLTRATPVKKRIEDNAVLLQQHAALVERQLPKLKAPASKDMRRAARFRELTGPLVDQFDLIRLAVLSRRLALNTEALEQIALASDRFVSLLRDIRRRGLNSADLDWLKTLADDMGVWMLAFKETKAPGELPDRSRLVNVRVRTVRMSGGAKVEVPGLRVHYAPEALASQGIGVRQFARLTSPAEQPLPEANYRIWTGDGPPNASSVRAEVRMAFGEHEVELLVP
ncbi:hypothetical protein [Sorangium sp. So ce394]|uniref:hypothetical protein n=1 Tax=Sorangium sp. So ce394 TaxID=3133310 RepID=UPI003F5BEC28